MEAGENPKRIDGGDSFRAAYSTVCTFCKHYHRGTFTCVAFSARIPDEIWNGNHDHRTAYAGDGGVRFEPLQAE